MYHNPHRPFAVIVSFFKVFYVPWMPSQQRGMVQHHPRAQIAECCWHDTILEMFVVSEGMQLLFCRYVSAMHAQMHHSSFSPGPDFWISTPACT